MSIGHLTFSTLGGAGKVAERLSKYQNDLGHDAKLIALSKGNVGTDPFARPLLTVRALTDKYIVQIKPQNSLFSDFRKKYSGVDPKELKGLNVLNLHWVEGVVSEPTLIQLKRSSPELNIYWTLHDMAPFTGGCHHAHNCEGYKFSCDKCPQVRTIFTKQISNNFTAQTTLTDFYETTTFVAPSVWMAQKAKDSSLLRNSKIVTIPNPVEDVFFNANTQKDARKLINLDDQATVGVVVAADLQDPNKNVNSSVAVFLQLVSHRKDCILLLVGKNGQHFSNMHENIIWLGELNPTELSKIGAAADYVSVASIAETAPLVIGEFAAMGVPAVTVGDTGASSMVEHLKTGIQTANMDDYFEIICRLRKGSALLENLSNQTRQVAKDKFNPLSVAQNYLKLYQADEK